MAEILISPGVLPRENDQSLITNQPVQAGAAIVGPTVKGKVNRPTIVTSYSEYLATFGSTLMSGSEEFTFFTSISAYNYFQNGGDSLLVTRVASGSFTSATSSKIEGNTGLVEGVGTYTTNSFDNEGVSGSITGVTGSSDGSGTGAEFSIVLTSDTVIDTITVTETGSGYVVGEIITIPTASLGATGGAGTDLTLTLVSDNIQESGELFVLETLSEGTIMNSTSTENTKGALASGSEDNIRWEISNSNPSQGVFSLIVRRGDDTTKTKSVLETFANLSLDPKSPNYVAKVIGDETTTLVGSGGTDPYLQYTGSFGNSSRYIRVKSVGVKTPDFFDNSGVAKPQYTGSIPLPQSGSFGNATGTTAGAGSKFYQNINNTDSQGVEATDYTDALNLLKSDQYQYNIITTPGLTYQNANSVSTLNTLITNVEDNGSSIIVMDLANYGSTVANVTSQAALLDSSYAASYWPWLQVTDPDTSQLVWVPASTLIPGVYVSSDKTSEAWFAPAGINRGGLNNVNQAERRLTQPNKDTLYLGKVNPIASLPGRGVVVFGQKTLQTKSTSLDRVNVRRLLIELKSYISEVADTLVFEQNTISTRNGFLSQVNPYLESVQQRQGLYAFKVVMDNTNNTPDVIDRNELIGAVYLQPTKTAEFIYLDFNILPTGATFPA